MTLFSLFVLQIEATDFWVEPSFSIRETLIFLIIGAVVLGFIIILNLSKKGSSGKKTGGGGGFFSAFALHKLIRDLGLNHEQKKMLDFVFKTDSVTDPEKSINTSVLLDRHFRRAYRVIEQSSGTDAEIQRRLAVLFSTRNILENSVFGGFTSTRQIKDDTTLIINTGKDKISVNVVSTKNENLLVETPKSILGSQIKIAKGTKLGVLFFTKNNKGFSFETRVTGYSTMHGRPVMQLAHSNSLRFLSQRRFRRKHAVIACFLNLVYVEGSGKKQRLVVDKRRLSANIADISVGGCSIKTTAPVQVGAKFKIEFTQGDNNVAALGQVLRTNRSGGITIIHIKFLRVTQKSMNLINAFVYEYANE
jgi:c-di-GMP-binding flagellar brake protein YcgR